ncbi:hypothetical protein VTP01DRAFT_1800 [Rhizomucor pusillus]|uniref:uncharacterized protein n=1 Tax=Rhizomucor pusillus TaxID=4840 RepID=UPI003742A537
MSAKFLYEDGQRNIVDESGRPEPMDYVLTRNNMLLKRLVLIQYLQKMPAEKFPRANATQADKSRDEDSRMRDVTEKRAYTSYTLQDKARFFKLKIENTEMGQKYEERPDSIFESVNAALIQAEFRSLERNSPEKIEERHDWVRKWAQTDTDFMTNCFLKNLRFI